MDMAETVIVAEHGSYGNTHGYTVAGIDRTPHSRRTGHAPKSLASTVASTTISLLKFVISGVV